MSQRPARAGVHPARSTLQRLLDDVDGVVAMLAADARMTMPPLPSWFSGRDQIGAFLRAFALSDTRRWKLAATSANGQPALAGYLWDEQAETFAPYCLYVLTFHQGEIEDLTAFVMPETFRRFDLPDAIAH